MPKKQNQCQLAGACAKGATAPNGVEHLYCCVLCRCPMTRGYRATLIFSTLALLTVMGCAKDVDPGGDQSDESFSEIAASSVSGSIAAVSGGNTSAFHAAKPVATLLAAVRSLLEPFPAAFATTACPRFTESPCTSPEVMESVYRNCQFMNADGNFSKAMWSGTQLLRFGEGAKCGQAAYTTGTITRVFRPGTSRSSVNGMRVLLDSDGRSGWHKQIAGGTILRFTGINTQTMVINGIHYIGTKTHKTHMNSPISTRLMDHTLATVTPISSDVINGRRVLVSGSLLTQNNLDHSTATTTITTALELSPTCCHPIAGKLTTEITGGRAGTETLTFTGACSVADLSDVNGVTRQISLTHCL